MLGAVTKAPKTQEKTRTHVGTFDEPWDDTNVFTGCVTLDPSKIDEAWSRLNVNTWALEFKNMPAIMHFALVHTLKGSAIFGRERG